MAEILLAAMVLIVVGGIIWLVRTSPPAPTDDRTPSGPPQPGTGGQWMDGGLSN